MEVAPIEREVTIAGEPALRGTLTDAPPGSPGLLFLAGSGPIDRNENAPGLRMNIFGELAGVTSSLGFVTLRYDKRGVGESEGDYFSAGLWDLVDDAGRALDYLKAHPSVDPGRIVVLGHSEGVTLAAALNQRHPVQGLILVAGAARSMRETILWQGEALFREIETMGGLRGTLARLLGVPRRARREMARTHEAILRSERPVMRIKGQKINAKWLREHFAYDLRDALDQVICPVLVVAGTKDIQIPLEEADRIAALVRGPVERLVIKDMNHILRLDRTSPSMLAVKGHYKAMSALGLHPELVEAVSGWLKTWVGSLADRPG